MCMVTNLRINDEQPSTFDKPVKSSKDMAGEEEQVEEVDSPPDGGFGWVVAAAGFMIILVIDSIPLTFGNLLEPLVNHYHVSYSEVSAVGSILSGVYFGAGVLGSFLVDKFGSRPVCLTGVVISALAFFLSTFSSSVPILVVLYGVGGGLGIGLMYTPVVVSVGYWFNKRRALATGISLAGSGFGTLVFAPLFAYLVSDFGWQMCNRVVAIICLVCIGFGAALIPSPNNKNQEKEETCFSAVNSAVKSAVNGKWTKGKWTKEKWTRAPIKTTSDVGGQQKAMKVATNISYMLIGFSNIPAMMAMIAGYTFIPKLSEERNITSTESSLVFAVAGVCNSVGRVALGAITDHPQVDPLVVTIISLFFGSVSISLVSICHTFPTLATVFSMFAFSLSAWVSVVSPMMIDLLGLDLLTISFAGVTFFRGVGAALGPTVAGYIVDTTGNVSLVFIISGCLLGFATLIHIFAWVIILVKKMKQRVLETANRKKEEKVACD